MKLLHDKITGLTHLLLNAQHIETVCGIEIDEDEDNTVEVFFSESEHLNCVKCEKKYATAMRNLKLWNESR